MDDPNTPFQIGACVVPINKPHFNMFVIAIRDNFIYCIPIVGDQRKPEKFRAEELKKIACN
jgi:hypothetical protein